MMQQALLSTIIIIVTAAFIGWLNKQKHTWIQQLLNWFPAILFAYVIPALITHTLGIDLSSVYLHSLSRNWIIPIAILMVMSALSFPQLKKVGARPILLFFSGSLMIAILPPFLVWCLQFVSENSFNLFIEQEYWRGLVPIAGSWIGGSTSQLVLKELVNCPESLFLSVIVFDNILVNIWTILMFQVIKRSDWINELLRISNLMPEVHIEQSVTGSRSYDSIIISLIAVVVTVCAINFISDIFLWRVIMLTCMGLILGNFVPRWNHQMVLKAGGLLIILIMAILGLRLDFSGLRLPISFVMFCIVWLIGHYLFLLLYAKLLNVHMAWVPIASMANLGGISTAPAVTSAYNKTWMPHAIMLAILSMVTGNAWGMISIYLFSLFY